MKDQNKKPYTIKEIREWQPKGIISIAKRQAYEVSTINLQKAIDVLGFGLDITI
jgi:hypothetical protein